MPENQRGIMQWNYRNKTRFVNVGEQIHWFISRFHIISMAMRESKTIQRRSINCINNPRKIVRDIRRLYRSRKLSDACPVIKKSRSRNYLTGITEKWWKLGTRYVRTAKNGFDIPYLSPITVLWLNFILLRRIFLDRYSSAKFPMDFRRSDCILHNIGPNVLLNE